MFWAVLADGCLDDRLKKGVCIPSTAVEELVIGAPVLMLAVVKAHAGETSVPVHLVAKLADRVSGETLSRREIEVLKLMAQGKSNKEIASALFISEGTVKSHGKAIFAKMNVVSRTEAVADATRRGLIRL